METFVAVIHVLTAISLIALVLLQDSKGGGVGGAFGGGGSNSILGATGGATLAQKMTRIAAIIFALTSIGLTTFANKRNSVVDDLPPAAATEQSAAPVSGDPTPGTAATEPSAVNPNTTSTTTTTVPAKK